MKDYLQNEFISEAIKRLGIPLPVPTPLNRDNSPYSADSIKSKLIIINDAVANSFHTSLCNSLSDMCILEDVNQSHAEALIFDATAFDELEDLDDLYTYFHQNIKKLERNGRMIIIDRYSSKNEIIHAAIVGVVKSLAKEIGPKGSTANLITIASEKDTIAAETIIGSIYFLLSDKSSFITGQTFFHNLSNTKNNIFENLLENKIALVTGAARGIGAETAVSLAREGAKVILVDVPQASTELNALASKINGIALPLDITASDVLQKIQEQAANLGGIDILVNNAGIIRDKTIANMTFEQWQKVLQVNLQAVINITEGLLKSGLNKGASIVALSSINGIAGAPGQTNYAATKSAVIAYMSQVSKNNSAKNITANAIAPGFIETPMTEKLPFFVAEGGRRLSSLRQAGLPFDIAESITFLVSPLGKNISGSVLRVCGGNFIGA